MHAMFTVAGLGLRALVAHWRTVVIMALTIALSLAAFLLLSAYRAMSSRYAQLSESFLVAEQIGSIGEFYGSRLPIAAAETLRSAGAGLIVPEIHTVTGTTTANAVLLRGVSLDEYTRIESFRITAGRALQPGDPPRTVMVGDLLAKERGAAPGGLIQIRGRDFTVAGIFAIGTYADHEVWMSLADAQELLGWGSDVSIFIVPAGETLKEGDELPGQIALVRKGESGVNLVKEWVPLFDLFDLVAASLGHRGRGRPCQYALAHGLASPPRPRHSAKPWLRPARPDRIPVRPGCCHRPPRLSHWSSRRLLSEQAGQHPDRRDVRPACFRWRSPGLEPFDRGIDQSGRLRFTGSLAVSAESGQPAACRKFIVTERKVGEMKQNKLRILIVFTLLTLAITACSLPTARETAPSTR